MPVVIKHQFVSAVVDGPDATVARPSDWNAEHTVSGLAIVATSGSYDDLTGKPALFDGLYASLGGQPILGSAAATNSGDYATAAQGVKADSAVQPARTVNAHPLSADVTVTKGDVGLGNVDDTSDLGKPISTATQAAIDEKQSPLVSGTNIKTINGSSVLGSGDLVVSGAAAWGGVTGTLSAQTDLQNALDAKLSSVAAAWPIGSVFISVVSTNPGTLLGFGTWSAFGAGRVLVGLDAAQTEFDTVEETGGAKTHTLTATEMPTHTHVQDAHTHTQNAHTHNFLPRSATTGSVSSIVTGTLDTSSTISGSNQPHIQNATAVNQNATATNQNTGGGGAHNNLQPYIVCYFFKRTA